MPFATNIETGNQYSLGQTKTEFLHPPTKGNNIIVQKYAQTSNRQRQIRGINYERYPRSVREAPTIVPTNGPHNISTFTYVPNVISKTLHQATELIRRSLLNLGNVNYVPDNLLSQIKKYKEETESIYGFLNNPVSHL